MIVGTKSDLERKLPQEEIEATVCLDWECGYAECSSKTGNGVTGVFQTLLNQAKSKLQPDKPQSSVAQSLCSAASMTEKPSASHLKRHSLVRRLFSKEKTKEMSIPEENTETGCKIS